MFGESEKEVQGRRRTLLLLLSSWSGRVLVESFGSACGACNQATTNHHDPSPSFSNCRPTFFSLVLKSAYFLLYNSPISCCYSIHPMNQNLVYLLISLDKVVVGRQVRPANTFPAADA